MSYHDTTSLRPLEHRTREPTMTEMALHGTPHYPGRPLAPLPSESKPNGKVNAYLSDVFALPKLKDHMQQYNMVIENLGKQQKWNESSCKKDMNYHKNRYEKIYTDARASPTLGPVRGLTTGPWPSSKSVEHPLTNDNIYIDARRSQPGDNSLFKAPWRVLKEEFPPKSGKVVSGKHRNPNRSGKSGRRSGRVPRSNKPSPASMERARTLVAPFLAHTTTNSMYGSTVSRADLNIPRHTRKHLITPAPPIVLNNNSLSNHNTPDPAATSQSPSQTPGAVTPSQVHLGSMNPTPEPLVRMAPKPPAMAGGPRENNISPRRYKGPCNDDWKTEAWRRANKEYRAYRDATKLSGIPVNRRVSNFIFGGNVVLA